MEDLPAVLLMITTAFSIFAVWLVAEKPSRRLLWNCGILVLGALFSLWLPLDGATRIGSACFAMSGAFLPALVFPNVRRQPRTLLRAFAFILVGQLSYFGAVLMLAISGHIVVSS